MQILLKNGEGRYLSCASTWLPEPKHAIQFASSVEAIDYVVRNQLRDVCVLLHFPDASLDLELPLRDYKPSLVPFAQTDASTRESCPTPAAAHLGVNGMSGR